MKSVSSLLFVLGALSSFNIFAGTPNDATWGTDQPCTSDSQFAAIPSGTDVRKALLSRHVACTKFVSPEVTFEMDLMRTADGKSWEPYKKGGATEVRTFTAGVGRIATYFQAYGAAKSLKIPHNIKVSVIKFTPSPSFPVPGTSFTIELTPTDIYPESSGQTNGVSNEKLTFTAPKISVGMSTGSSSSELTMPITVGWDSSSEQSLTNFVLRPTNFSYVINGAESQSGYARSFPAGSLDQGEATMPTLRCDKNMAKSGTSGCVFPQAAAVYVANRSTLPELVEHIELALSGQNTGMASPAPGLYVPMAGMRAVVSEGTPGLDYVETDAEKNNNRGAACGNGSNGSPIIKDRPSASASCAGSVYGQVVAGCSCDEYPFASTMQGAARKPLESSARYINASQNSTQGSEMSSMLIKERVLRYRYTSIGYSSQENFWVFIK